MQICTLQLTGTCLNVHLPIEMYKYEGNLMSKPKTYRGSTFDSFFFHERFDKDFERFKQWNIFLEINIFEKSVRSS